jgi:hypothetical protein
MAWYNFLFHVDRKLEISDTLSSWALEVSQPYLQRHAPHFLAINTLDNTWNDYIRGEHDVMDIDTAQWTQVGSKMKTTRSQSPPKSTSNWRIKPKGSRENTADPPAATQTHDDIQNTADNPIKVVNIDASLHTQTDWEIRSWIALKTFRCLQTGQPRQKHHPLESSQPFKRILMFQRIMEHIKLLSAGHREAISKITMSIRQFG